MSPRRSDAPATNLSVAKGVCVVEGAVVRTTVPALASAWQRLHPSERVDRVELGGVDQLDSAGIAFLLSMSEVGALGFVGLPERFRGLVALYRLEAVLLGAGASSPADSTDADVGMSPGA